MSQPPWTGKVLINLQCTLMTSIVVRFGIAVYKNTGLDDKGHIAFSRNFGELERVPKFRGPNVPDRL
jgi:hypothetical protein